MTSEEKELLLKDLCARLPYGVQAEGLYEEYDDNDEIIQIKTCGFVTWIAYNIITIGINSNCKLGTVKPYLRPMSSMTEEEKREYLEFVQREILDSGYVTENLVVSLAYMPGFTDWLNAHHFDYRGLIEKGLALEAPEGMYKQ